VSCTGWVLAPTVTLVSPAPGAAALGTPLLRVGPARARLHCARDSISFGASLSRSPLSSRDTRGLRQEVPARVHGSRKLDCYRKGVGVVQGRLNGKPVREADRIRAYELLLAYGWGKPAEFAAIEGANPLEHDDLDQAIASLVDELARKRAAEGSSQSTP
jgi:hypothetical protein